MSIQFKTVELLVEMTRTVVVLVGLIGLVDEVDVAADDFDN